MRENIPRWFDGHPPLPSHGPLNLLLPPAACRNPAIPTHNPSPPITSVSACLDCPKTLIAPRYPKPCTHIPAPLNPALQQLEACGLPCSRHQAPRVAAPLDLAEVGCRVIAANLKLLGHGCCCRHVQQVQALQQQATNTAGSLLPWVQHACVSNPLPTLTRMLDKYTVMLRL